MGYMARVAELADAPDLKSGAIKSVGVRVPPRALNNESNYKIDTYAYEHRPYLISTKLMLQLNLIL